jgi:hypothetical protein
MSDRANAPILVALITGFITVVGWFAAKWLDRQQQRNESRRAYIQRQIEEFYGPIYSLMWQMFSSNGLQQRILSKCKLSHEEQERVRQYFFETHFFPLHARIRGILETKLYLVDGTEMPRSVYDYLTHSQQEDIQRQLWTERGISTIAVHGTAFPPDFFDMVESTLKKLMREYEVSVQQLKRGSSNEEDKREERARSDEVELR